MLLCMKITQKQPKNNKNMSNNIFIIIFAVKIAQY